MSGVQCRSSGAGIQVQGPTMMGNASTACCTTPARHGHVICTAAPDQPKLSHAGRTISDLLQPKQVEAGSDGIELVQIANGDKAAAQRLLLMDGDSGDVFKTDRPSGSWGHWFLFKVGLFAA